MKNQSTLDPSYLAGDPPPLRWRLAGADGAMPVSRHLMIALILAVALIAFEIFNFDTTRYALSDFLGDISFGGVSWAAILAVAFCAIDFAGLVRLFTPERGGEEPKEVWYLMGAWLLGATMNAVMTWWAVSLTLLNHSFGNEVLGREQLLKAVPIFVAVLVWLTRILFIGAVSVTGEKLLDMHRQSRGAGPGGARRPAKAATRSADRSRPNAAQLAADAAPRPATPRPATPQRAAPSAPAGRAAAQIKERRSSDPPSQARRSQDMPNGVSNGTSTVSRPTPQVRRKPDMPGNGLPVRPRPRTVQARGREL